MERSISDEAIAAMSEDIAKRGVEKEKDTMLVGFANHTGKSEDAVIIVGKKRFNGSVKIINSIHGQEAIDIYEKLISKKENSDG